LIAKDALRDVLYQPGLSRLDQLLLCLAADSDEAKQVREITAIAVEAGLRSVQKWNISSYLGRSKGSAVRTGKGWVLTSKGKAHVQDLAGGFLKTPKIRVAASLRSHLSQIQDHVTARFVEEAVDCFEAGYHRAAVVLSWVGAVSVLYEYVVKNKLQEFNTEVKRRNPNWKDANTRDDLARMKEHDFLDVLEAISVLGKSVKQEIQNCLRLRNGCGHPNTLSIGENRVSAHIETLILNVFSRFMV